MRYILAQFFSTFSHSRGSRSVHARGTGFCRVAAAYVSACCMLAFLFRTISHCPWRDFISWSFGDKETKQRKRLPTIYIKCPQRADHCFWLPRRTVLAKPRTLETLFSRILTSPRFATSALGCSRARTRDPQTCTASPVYAVSG
jgi:hypothetical protein